MTRTFIFGMKCPNCGYHYKVELQYRLPEYEHCPICGNIGEFFEFCTKENIAIPYNRDIHNAYFREGQVIDSHAVSIGGQLENSNLIIWPEMN